MEDGGLEFELGGIRGLGGLEKEVSEGSMVEGSIEGATNGSIEREVVIISKSNGSKEFVEAVVYAPTPTSYGTAAETEDILCIADDNVDPDNVDEEREASEGANFNGCPPVKVGGADIALQNFLESS